LCRRLPHLEDGPIDAMLPSSFPDVERRSAGCRKRWSLAGEELSRSWSVLVGVRHCVVAMRAWQRYHNAASALWDLVNCNSDDAVQGGINID
jgi:hypothetical protein